MIFVQWLDDKYSVQIREIDQQHRTLVGLINEVFEAKTNDLGKKVIAGLLERLADYTKNHFATEEALMEEYGYPELEAHRKEHQFFTTKVGDFYRAFNTNQDYIIGEILDFLKNWLVKHIMEMDKGYGRFLTERGVK